MGNNTNRGTCGGAVDPEMTNLEAKETWSVIQKLNSERFQVVYADGDAELGNWLIADNILDRSVADEISKLPNLQQQLKEKEAEINELLCAVRELRAINAQGVSVGAIHDIKQQLATLQAECERTKT